VPKDSKEIKGVVQKLSKEAFGDTFVGEMMKRSEEMIII